MAYNAPVNFSEVLNLETLGINGGSVKFGSCTMESDKFVVVCEVLESGRQLVIVDLQNGGSVTRKSMAAEAAIMNPITKVIALKAGQQLQIFNLDLQSKMKSHQAPEPIIYWRWITPNTIALVSATSVFHWKIDGDSAPTKIFDRHVNIGSNHQIINYSVSQDSQWCLLCGISQVESSIQGTMQLYSVEKAVSQILQGHIGTFSVFELPGREPAQILSFFEKKPDSQAKLYVMEVGRDKDAPGGVFRVQPQIIPMPSEAANDFPVALQVGASKGIVYMITKMGFLYLFDLYSAKTIYRAKISNEVVFATCQQLSSGGILGITVRTGRILHISINEQNLVPFIVSTLNDPPLAISLAGRLNLQGADDLYLSEFNRLISIGDIRAAASLAAESPRGILRTPQTIQIFQKLPAVSEGPQPLLQYFSVLLDKGKLNRNESLELVRPVIRQGRRDLVEKWLQDDKLEASEELGDLLGVLDINLALSVYHRSNSSEKVINCLIQKGDFTKIIPYVNSVGYKCDFSFILQNLVRSNPQAAAEFAKQLVTNENRPLIDLPTIIDIFMSVSRIQETTAILLEALKGNKPEEGYLQTKLLEINLLGGFPQVADAILQNNMFSHYDRVAVAKMCERAGLHQRALEHYTDTNDIKRAMNFGAGMSPEFVIAFFSRLTPEVAIEVLRDMLGKNLRTNLNLVVQVASKYYEQIGSAKLIQMFEDYKCNEGLFYFLSSIVNFSQEPVVHLKFIQAAAKMGQFKEVERVCRDSQVYNPQEVKEFLMESKLSDPRPLIHVCDRFDFIEELTGYLYSNNLHKYIEVYVQKVSPQKTPQVIGKLLDVDCNEDFIRSLLNYVGSMCPVDELVEQVERRNRLRILQPWLEALVATGNTETPTHNAIGKIYVTLNRDPVKFLENNQFYDPKVIGAFCEKLDPSLAVIAYRRAGGQCDDELLRVTSKNGLFKAQARYLLEKQDIPLWGRVLQSTDGELTNKRALIDQVVQSLPETKNPDEVSCTVRAFLDAGLERELIELLERIVLQGSDFSDNRNLQNLLILTAMKADPSRVMDYVNRLDNFDGPEIAKIAKGDPYELYEEAFAIYVKTAKKSKDDAEREEMDVCAIEVLVLDLHDVTRGQEFAQRVNEKRVWSKLAEALMRSETICEAMQAFIRADDPSVYDQVIELAQAADEFETLVPYLRMARKQVKQSKLDTALIYSLAKTQKLGDLEEFLSAPNVADIQGVGESCFNEGMFEAAKLLFKSNNNNAKLALCYINLGRFREAVEAAQKANAIATWKQVNRACVEAGEFRLAATCGLKIIIHPDHLEELINHYETAGHVEELMQLLEQGLGLEDAHTGIFTELGVLYSKYKSKKLMEHITIFFSRLNVSKLLRACERSKLWNEVVYLYKEDKQFDSAVRTMIDHPISFQIELFLDCVQKVRNAELHYMAIGYFLDQHPLELEKLLQILVPQLDHSRVVNQLKRHDHIPLAVNYLKSVQKENIAAVNSALNELYIEEEDIELLRLSIEEHDNFDQIALARHIESHELVEFRRIAAYLYKRNKRWSQSVELSKSNKMYKDAIDTTATSQDPELVENLLKFFVSQKNKECFCATLYTCYSLARPDVAVELAWRNGYVDFVMPYMIQYLRHTHEKIRELDTRTAVKQTETSTEVANAVASQFMLNNNLLLTNGPQGFDTGFNSNMMGINPGMGLNVMPQPPQGFYGYQQGTFGGGAQW